MNDMIQAVSVAVILAIAAVWIVRRIRRGGSASSCDCGECPVKDSCRKPGKGLNLANHKKDHEK